MEREYDVALSFAGEQRSYVHECARELKRRNIAVFYDEMAAVDTWGKDLYQYFHELYSQRAIHTVLFASKEYAEKRWTRHELRAAQSRALSEGYEYILPARFDDTEIPGLPSTVGYLDLMRTTPNELADMIVEKLKSRSPEFDASKIIDPTPDYTSLPSQWGDSVIFFDQRFGNAFPEVSRVATYTDRQEIHDRLSILLRDPISGPLPDAQGTSSPIWWWRGPRNLHITKFEILTPSRCILNVGELKISKLVAATAGSYYHTFVYIETESDSPSGAYQWTSSEIEQWTAEHGYCWEEMGYYDGCYYTRTEFDNGRGITDGRVVDFNGEEELRTRYLSPYNLLIAGQAAPVNGRLGVDDELQSLLNEIILGSRSIEDLVGWYSSLPPAHRRY